MNSIAATTRPLLLGILVEGENYGYALIQRVKELSNGRLEWTEGMLYPGAASAGVRRADFTAEWKEGDSGRKRKYYRLTNPAKPRRLLNASSGSRSTKPSTALWNPTTA